MCNSQNYVEDNYNLGLIYKVNEDIRKVKSTFRKILCTDIIN